MRIIAGTHRGTHLTEVGAGDEAAHLRPTSDRVRESMFNVLQGGRYGDPLRGTRVLDLFAGTGALGLEALSRGAAHVTFVDNGRVAQGLIRANIAKLRRQDDTKLITTSVTALPTGQPCDLVFLDPPYGLGLGQAALEAALRQGWIAADALIVWEEARAQMAPAGFAVADQRRYGETWVTLLRRTQAG
ncbi:MULTISPECIES: 16S rRNA (guanine(966)-N(2))-methyltransferase RsmD [unclassified Yoonia]|uniref:16S rRNA (guanine(966)-N(2))-methyltransferase RsmD n=1 Tax=unclassified Yoonia TaxID=2629118 RepID=UPI002AFE4201|nr:MULTISPECIES: 16S rRNA (guanine(966)-N(2))-methyltransferase RsmD [unclassified Yoonia]